MQVIAGKFRHRELKAPKGDKTRPTSSKLREAVFNILQSVIDNSSFLDIFSGSGAIGIEALSRGAEKVAFIDNSKEAITALKENIRALHIEKECEVFYGDYLKVCQKLVADNKNFDVIYADAPYQYSLETTSNLIEFLEKYPLLKAQGRLFIENTIEKPPTTLHLKWLNTRRSGKAFLHQFEA